MGKMSELDNVIKELRCAASSISDLADTLTELFSSKPEPVKEETKTYTLAEVRAVLAEKSRSGHTKEVKELLAKYGADKLSDVKEEDYAKLIADAEGL